jgi:hypothetical protein
MDVWRRLAKLGNANTCTLHFREGEGSNSLARNHRAGHLSLAVGYTGGTMHCVAGEVHCPQFQVHRRGEDLSDPDGSSPSIQHLFVWERPPTAWHGRWCVGLGEGAWVLGDILGSVRRDCSDP